MAASKLKSELRLSYDSKNDIILNIETVHNETTLAMGPEVGKIKVKVDKAALIRLQSVISSHIKCYNKV